MEKWTSPTGTSEHLAPEVLAAFLDGELSQDENREVRGHLAECEDCHQVFVEAVNFLREEDQREREGTVRPFDPPKPRIRPPKTVPRRSWSRWAAVAATVVLAVGAGNFVYSGLRNPGIPTASVRPENLPGSTHRDFSDSPALTPSRREFLLGAAMLDLSVKSKAGANVASTLTEVDALLKGDVDLRRHRVAGTDAKAAETLLKADLRKDLLEPQWFDLGGWTEAGAAASGARKAELFRGWGGFRYRWTLRRLLRQADGRLDKDALQEMRKIEVLLDAPTLDFAQLQSAYERLLRLGARS